MIPYDPFHPVLLSSSHDGLEHQCAKRTCPLLHFMGEARACRGTRPSALPHLMSLSPPKAVLVHFIEQLHNLRYALDEHLQPSALV